MSDSHRPAPPVGPVDELVTQLLEVGGVLSQIVSHMVAFQASGRSAPDAAPIPDTAHTVIRGALEGVQNSHSTDDIRVAATIIADSTEAICENLFFVGPELN